MLSAVLCVQFGGILMNIMEIAEAHHVFNSLVDESVKSLRRADVPLRTVSVTCSPSAMEVHVKADLFDLGVPVNPEHVTLGEHCGVTKASPEEFIIHTALTDCGTQYWLTANALVYTNVLVYTPVTSGHKVIRRKTFVPVECVYRRRFGVDSVPVIPSWLPHAGAHSAEHTLHFTLRLMTTDWQTVREGVYFLGDVINIEASVFAPLLELRVFVQDCVATTTCDVNSVPRYKFIQNGCFTDGQQTSSKSHFLPRIQSDKLLLQLHTFIFRQVHRAQIFISCSLKADLQSSSSSRACSYIQGSWRSADGDDTVCESCQIPDQLRQKQNIVERQNTTQAGSVLLELGEPELRTPGSMWKNPEPADTHALQQEVRIGPLSLSSWTTEPLRPEVKEGVHISYVPSLKTKRLMANALQGNISTPGSEYVRDVPGETAEQESSASAEQEMGVSLATPTPELGLTVTPLMFTTPEATNTVFTSTQTKLTTAAVTADTPGADEVPDGTELWSRELNSALWAGLMWDTPPPDSSSLGEMPL